MFTNSASRDRNIRLAYTALAVLAAVGFDAVTHNQVKGLGFFVFVLCFSLAFLGLATAVGHVRQRWPMWLLVPILILSFDVFLYNNFLVRYWVPIVVEVLMLGLIILVTLRHNGKQFYFKNIPVVQSPVLPFKNWGQVFRDIFRAKETKHGPLYKNIAIGIVVAIPLLIVFSILFSLADPVFSDAVEKLFDIRLNFNIETAWHAITVGVLALILAGVFYTVIHDNHELKDRTWLPWRLDKTVMSIVFGLVNALFLCFVFIQIKYLFGSANYISLHNITYAQYARSGFFELVLVMVISGLLLLSTYRSTAHHGTHTFLKVLKVLLVAQVLLIAGSALKRMNMYQEAYGFTTQRLYVEWFIYIVGVGLIGLSAAVVRSWPFRAFFYVALAGSIAVFTLVASINVDALIANRNIKRAVALHKPLDIHYLLYLSVDAFPPVFDALNADIPLEEGTKSDSRLTLGNIISNNVSARGSSWRQFNYGMYQAERLLPNLLQR